MNKLLDLQTGEFLELGRDWLDGGEYISISNHYSRFLEVWDEDKNDYIPGIPQGQILDGQATVSNICYKCNPADLPDPLRQLVVRIRAVCYGNRYILYQDGHANIIKIDEQGSSTRYRYGIGGSFFQNEILGNIFIEYSKSLRGEENKFEEFMKLID